MGVPEDGKPHVVPTGVSCVSLLMLSRYTMVVPDVWQFGASAMVLLFSPAVFYHLSVTHKVLQALDKSRAGPLKVILKLAFSVYRTACQGSSSTAAPL